MSGEADRITPLVLDVKQASIRTGLAVITLNKLRWKGGGPPFVKMTATRVGYVLSELDAWIEARPRYRSTSDSASSSAA